MLASARVMCCCRPVECSLPRLTTRSSRLSSTFWEACSQSAETRWAVRLAHVVPHSMPRFVQHTRAPSILYLPHVFYLPQSLRLPRCVYHAAPAALSAPAGSAAWQARCALVRVDVSRAASRMQSPHSPHSTKIRTCVHHLWFASLQGRILRSNIVSRSSPPRSMTCGPQWR